MLFENTVTEFASPARLSLDEIIEQNKEVSSLPFMREILDSMPIPVVVLNKYRQIIFYNRMFTACVDENEIREILGTRPGEALGCIHAFETPGGCGTTKFCKNCGAVKSILSSINKGKISQEECCIIKKNGEALDLMVKAVPIELDGERFTLFSVQDISNEKRRRVLERIFFHDLMNIAGCLFTSSELLLLTGSDDKEHVMEMAEIMYQASKTLMEEITGQRTLLQAENNDIKVKSEKLNSLQICENILEMYRKHNVCEGKNIEISPDSQDVEFISDKSLVMRVIGNMTKNALEAVQPGETVTLFNVKESDEILFSVHNPGYIPKNTQLQMFKRSFSTKGDGRGLGTYSMKLLGEKFLGGKISFISIKEEGTTFMVRLPLKLSNL